MGAKEDLLKRASELRDEYAGVIVRLHCEDEMETYVEIGQMLIDLMDVVEQQDLEVPVIAAYNAYVNAKACEECGDFRCGLCGCGSGRMKCNCPNGA